MLSFQNCIEIEKIIPVVSISPILEEEIIVISHTNNIFAFNVLKNHFAYQYKLLSCISGIDYINSKYRFGVVYDLLSIKYNSRLRVKLFVNEITSVNSITNIYINSDWWEREVWDMYGIYFDNHKDLRRILTDYGFEGHPLRKDFPLSGYIELKYDQTKKRIVLEPLELAQEFRNYSFEMPWK